MLLDLGNFTYFGPGVRKTDPATSKVAAVRATLFAWSHRGRILDALRTHGPHSPKELEQLIGLSTVQIDRRLPEILAAGEIEVVQENGADVVRGGCRVWRAVCR